MNIVTLVENTTTDEQLQTEHGLSLYIETKKHKLLIDTGAGGLFLKNAKLLGVDIAAVDTLIITHGHSDHGGGLKQFLEINKTARIYIQSSAFAPHYTKVAKLLKVNIGLDTNLKQEPQIVLVDGDKVIDDELTLITNPSQKKLLPTFNATLFKKQGRRYIKDEFTHEQSVIITENKTVLIGGCGHRGIVNILSDAVLKSKKEVDVCVSGFHLFNLFKSESPEVLEALANELAKTSTKFFTCHCTGKTAYEFLRARMSEQINYLSTGQTLNI